MKDLTGLDQAIDSALARLGLGPLGPFEELAADWEELAGSPWAGHSRPVLLRNGELLIEAPVQAVALLRYAVGDLQRRIDARFGAGLVESIRVKGVAS